MGNPMARNLVKKGYPLHVFDIAPEKMQPLVEMGAEPRESARDVAQKTEVVIIKNCTLKGKFERGVFPVDYVLKDPGLAMAVGAKYHVPLYFGSVATQAYESARAARYSDRYGPVVIKPLEQLTGVEVRGDVESG
jgi:3-hydroxyisobutyrate dehydrogenase-like beta-hydroxyacid dehydrogenase